MTVQEDLTNLINLQETDLKSRNIRDELDNIPKEIDEIRNNVETVRSILKKEHDKLDDAETWYREKENEIKLQNDLMSKSKAKQQAARKEKESKAAQREIDTIKKNIDTQEKEKSELTEAIEQYKVAIDEHKKEFAELEEELEQRVKEGERRMEEIRGSLVDVDRERKKLTSIINPKSLRYYERIHRRLLRAIVKVTEPTCVGCNFQIRPQIFNDLIRGETLITCQNCHRILVYDGEPAIKQENG